MNLLHWTNKLSRGMITEESRLRSVDQLTKFLASSISRRTFVKRLLAGGTRIGLSLFESLPAQAACTTCNYCTGQCGCNSDVTCCSPDGAKCYYQQCTISNCITPPGTYPWIQVCNGCSATHGCGTCFW